MSIQKRFYHGIARLLPHQYKAGLKQLSIYAGEQLDINFYLGSATLLALLVLIAISLIPFALSQRLDLKYVLLGVLGFLLVELIAYFAIYFKAEDRTKRVEEVLPDALQLTAANIRAGMTPYQALKRSARKEFGPLAEEINHTTARALGTESFSELLLGISKRIKSELLDRAMGLFTTAMRAGGRLATLLEELARDIGETKALKKELVTATKTYSAFIMFTIIIGAPLLLAVSIQFVDTVTAMQAKAGVSGADAGFGLGALGGQIGITSDFFTKMAIITLIITGLLASMLMGAISEGKPAYGLRYAPIIIVCSLVVFLACRYLVSGFFGSII